MRNVGSVFEKRAVEGIPGMFSATPAAPASCDAVRATVRRVSPNRTSFSTLAETARW
jgi:hypothetical protein